MQGALSLQRLGVDVPLPRPVWESNLGPPASGSLSLPAVCLLGLERYTEKDVYMCRYIYIYIYIYMCLFFIYVRVYNIIVIFIIFLPAWLSACTATRRPGCVSCLADRLPGRVRPASRLNVLDNSVCVYTYMYICIYIYIYVLIGTVM